MTSKNLFIKMLLQSIKERMWGMILSVAGLFFAFPVFAMISVEMIMYSAQTDPLKKALTKRLFLYDVLGEGNVPVILFTIFMAVFMAISCFSYLYSKQKVDLYHSIAVKREMIFGTNYLAGVITYFVPYIIFWILAALIGFVNKMLDGHSIVIGLEMMLINFVGYLLIYTFSILVIMITGNYQVGLFLLAAINAYFPIMGMVLDQLSTDYLKTSYSAYFLENSFVQRISPVAMYTYTAGKLKSFYMVAALPGKCIAVMITAIIIGILLNVFAYSRRPSEAAGRAMAFKTVERPLSVLLLVAASLSGGELLKSIIGYQVENDTVWFVFGTVATLIVGHFVIQALYYLDIKALVKNILNPAIAAVIAALIVSIYVFDITGFDNYVPSEKDFNSAAIASYGLQSGIEYFDFDAEVSTWGYVEYNKDAAEYRFDNMKITDYDAISEFVKEAIAQDKIYDGSEIDECDVTLVNVAVKFNLSNNRTKYREYLMDVEALKKVYAKIYESKEYKEAVYPLLTGTDYNLDELYYCDGNNRKKLDDLSDADKVELINTLKQEVYEQKTDEIIDKVPVGYFYINFTDTSAGYSAEYYTYKTYVYPGFSKTLKLMSEFNIPLNQLAVGKKIDYIELTRYTEADNQKVSYTDEKSINAVIENAYPYELLNEELSFHPTSDVEGYVSFGKDMDGENYYVSFEKGRVPDFVDNDLNNSLPGTDDGTILYNQNELRIME